ncbi:Uncharacterised protein [uncultured archaeon]|nr:Uncharacterised protein [uncultured archaeon]
MNDISLTNSAKHNVIMETQKQKLSIIIFIWSALLFFVNLFYHLPNEYIILIFWLSILLMVSTILYQIFFLKNNTFVLIEIFIIYFFLHLVYQIGYLGLRGSDSYIDYNLLKTILYTNHFTIEPGVSGWPMIHLFSDAVSLITKIDILLIAKYIPSFISSIIVLPIYLISYIAYKEKKYALLSCLFFSFIPQFVNFDALFVRETFGLFIMILFVYTLFIYKRKNDIRYIGLVILLIPVLLFSHHFASLILLVFLCVYFTVSFVVPFIYRLLIKKKIEFSDIFDIKIISLIVLISVISYWVYLKGGDWTRMFILGNIENVISPSISGSYSSVIGLGLPIVTLTGKIIFYGFLFFHILFSLILLMKLIIIKNIEKITDISFSILFYFGLGYGFLSLFVLNSSINPDRLLTYGWIFGIFPLIALLINIKKPMLKKILMVFFISFIIFNLYNIESDYYTGKVVTDGSVVTEKEYLIAEKINFPKLYYGYPSIVAAVYDIQGIPQRIGGLDLNKMVYTHNSSTLAVINEIPLLNQRENLKIKSEEQYNIINEILSYKDKKNIDKFYDLGSIYILKGV